MSDIDDSPTLTAFDDLHRALEESATKIVDQDRSAGYIETPASVWLAVDGSRIDFAAMKMVETMASSTGKRLKIFGPELNAESGDFMRDAHMLYAKTPEQLQECLFDGPPV